PAALIAMGLFAFDPNFLAHGALLKNDVPMALVMVWLMYSAWRFGQRATLAGLAGLALACGVAMVMKFSGAFYVVILLAALVIRSLGKQTWVAQTLRPLDSRMKRLGYTAAVMLVVGMVSYLVIWGVYRFRFSIAEDPRVTMNRSE